ncbi:hypothetical protein F5B20DRAFT_145238 [Whalleya microplaca]|nr:hypothetical protein F5B20DRAFT_145238 [Whalleya microplaca]
MDGGKKEGENRDIRKPYTFHSTTRHICTSAAFRERKDASSGGSVPRKKGQKGEKRGIYVSVHVFFSFYFGHLSFFLSFFLSGHHHHLSPLPPAKGRKRGRKGERGKGKKKERKGWMDGRIYSSSSTCTHEGNGMETTWDSSIGSGVGWLAWFWLAFGFGFGFGFYRGGGFRVWLAKAFARISVGVLDEHTHSHPLTHPYTHTHYLYLHFLRDYGYGFT